MTPESWLALVAVLLASVTAVVAALGVGLGIAAFIGWNGLKEELRARVGSVAEETTNSYLTSDALQELLAKVVSPMVEGMLLSMQGSQADDRQQRGSPIGLPYPGKDQRKADGKASQ